MAGRARGIVTPEAVLLQFDTAAVGSRSVAVTLDLLIQMVLLFGVFFVIGAAGAGGLPDVAAAVFVVVSLFAIFLGYPIAFETLWGGRTPGKAAMGLRVVTREGAPVRFRHAAIRGALGLVDLYLFLGSIAVVTSLLSRDDQRLGDLAAGTLVLRERTAVGNAASMVFPVPPGWEGYVALLDVSPVSTEQYGVVRDFLLRVGSLAASARAGLAVRLADPIAARMHHRPPGGVHPETFLVCVAAAYQQRRGGRPAPGGAVGRPLPPPPPGSTPDRSVPAPPQPSAPRGAPTPPPPPPAPGAGRPASAGTEDFAPPT